MKRQGNLSWSVNCEWTETATTIFTSCWVVLFQYWISPIQLFQITFLKNEIKLISSCIHCLQGRENSSGIPLVQQVVRCAQDPSYYLCPRIHYPLDIYLERAQKPLSDQLCHGRFIHEKEPWQSGYSYNRKNTHTWIHSVHGVCPKLWWVLNLFCINLCGDHFAGEGGGA